MGGRIMWCNEVWGGAGELGRKPELYSVRNQKDV